MAMETYRNKGDIIIEGGCFRTGTQAAVAWLRALFREIDRASKTDLTAVVVKAASMLACANLT
jgi:hypothetical protein